MTKFIFVDHIEDEEEVWYAFFSLKRGKVRQVGCGGGNHDIVDFCRYMNRCDNCYGDYYFVGMYDPQTCWDLWMIA
jgi:hypothetical protein